MQPSKRRPIIAGNWKMNKNVAEALALVRELRGLVSMVRDKVEVVVAPPFPSLQAVAKAIEDSNIALAAQNCHWVEWGAYTGEVSAPMLKEVGCRYVIVGHSERRQYFGETDETVNRRVRAVLEHGMIPIVCVGETLPERESQKTLEVVSRQLRGGLKDLSASQVASLVVAYEPVWAIGTGRNATSAQAQEVHTHIREQLIEISDRTSAEAVRIQYGGSVKSDNVADLLGQPDVD